MSLAAIIGGMKPAKLIEIERARELVLAAAAPLDAEKIPLDEALGRVLADELSSPEQVPAFDNSAMDGFALLSADTRGATPESPASLQVVGESRAGHPASGSLAPGEAIAISTGAMVPDGADAVIRVEDTRRQGDTVAVSAAVEPGGSIRRAGEDIEIGAPVIGGGTLIGAAEWGVLASVAAVEPSVVRRPRVAVLATGDELRGPGESLGPGQIRNSSSWTVPALATAYGAEVTVTTKVADTPEATREALDQALGGEMTVICGGVSVGEHDHVKGALSDLGVEQIFWGVALRPGKPTFFGRAAGGGLVLGLPGNPVSAMVTFLLFARPALLRMAGRDPESVRTTAALSAPTSKPSGRAHAARCSLTLTSTGWKAELMPHQGSHVLTSMIGADALALIPTDAESLEAGERVVVELLPEGGVGSRR